MVDLAAFSSVIQLSAAMHLAINLFFQLRLFFLQPYKNHADYIKLNGLPRLQKFNINADQLELALHQFDNIWFKAYFFQKSYLRVITSISLMTAFYSITLLIIIGFSPTSLSYSFIALILFMAIFPMLISLLILWYKIQDHKLLLISHQDTIQKEFTEALSLIPSE